MADKPDIHLVKGTPEAGSSRASPEASEPSRQPADASVGIEEAMQRALQKTLVNLVAEKPGGGGGAGHTNQALLIVVVLLGLGGFYLNGQVSEAKAIAEASSKTVKDLENKLVEIDRRMDKVSDLSERTIDDVRRNTQFLSFLTERLFPGEMKSNNIIQQ